MIHDRSRTPIFSKSASEKIAGIPARRTLNPFRLSNSGSQLTFILLHFPLGLALYFAPGLGVVQAWLAIAIGLVGITKKQKDHVVVLAVFGYIIGGEVLWRALELSPLVPYEGGKYAVLGLAAIGVASRYKNIREFPLIPFLIILCLLPSMLVLLGEADLGFLRKRVIGYLAGPFSLGLCAIYLNSLKLGVHDIKRFAICSLAPIASISGFAFYNTLIQSQAGTLYFGGSSNFTTSGGFGPNQVSNTLAFGALLCWLLLITFETKFTEKLILSFMLVGFTTQVFLTFSRGGAYGLGLSVMTTVVVFMISRRHPHKRNQKNLVWFAVFVLIFLFFILPWISEFTEGALASRYEKEDDVRIPLMLSELQMWLDHPFWGIGPGKTPELRPLYFSTSNQPHTEFTRLLAEHGMFGLMTVVFLIVGAVSRYRNQSSISAKVWVASLVIYAFFYMAQGATRTVSPSILYGAVWADLLIEKT